MRPSAGASRAAAGRLARATARPAADGRLWGVTGTAADTASPGRERGRLKVYLGFAAGVGKTYTMLEDAQQARAAGVDVVVGYVEPHARPATMALLSGLEIVPPRRIERAGAVLQDLDLEAVLARRARVVLVDELAHTNPPGSRNGKRFEDVRDILAAASDVWTTLNIQHLESLNDQVAAITHVRQRETLPDALLTQEADEVVAVDLPPEELRARIAQGHVYARERIPAALDGFFRQDRLTALREVALREMARVIEGHRVAEAGGEASRLASAGSVADRLLILAAGRPGDERVVRQGWRLARSLQCEAEVLHVVVEGTRHEPERLAEMRQICALLSLPLVVLPAGAGRHGVGEAVAAHARRQRVTHILAGAARDQRLPWRGSTLQEIMDRMPWADFTVVGDPARRFPGEGGP